MFGRFGSGVPSLSISMSVEVYVCAEISRDEKGKHNEMEKKKTKKQLESGEEKK